MGLEEEASELEQMCVKACQHADWRTRRVEQSSACSTPLSGCSPRLRACNGLASPTASGGGFDTLEPAGKNDSFNQRMQTALLDCQAGLESRGGSASASHQCPALMHLHAQLSDV